MSAQPKFLPGAGPLTPDELLSTALLFIDKAASSLEQAPECIRDALARERESVELFRASLAGDLYEAILDEGDKCRDCGYCQMDDGYTAGKGLTDEPIRECSARTPMACPAVAEIMGWKS